MQYGTSYADVNVICPFYHRTDGKEIVCEGLCDHTQNILRFGRKDWCREYMDMHCCSDYKSCEICRAASHKYI